MTKRERHMVTIQLADGELGERQKAAIEKLAEGTGRSLSEELRSRLLAAANAAELDLPPPSTRERAIAGGKAGGRGRTRTRGEST